MGQQSQGLQKPHSSWKSTARPESIHRSAFIADCIHPPPLRSKELFDAPSRGSYSHKFSWGNQ